MDGSDPLIAFDAAGVCSHCHEYDRKAALLPPRDGSRLEVLAERMRSHGAKRRYDCVIGVSGGVDSTYTAWVVKEKLGLRPLAVHLDNGWNSELAVANIERALKTLDIDLITHVLDWEEFRDLQAAFLRASVPDVEVATDHAIVAVLHRLALEHKAPWILSGSNFATEAVMSTGWAYGHGDWRYIRAVHRRHGTVPLRTFPHFSFTRFSWWRFVRKVRTVHIPDHLEYDHAEVRTLLQDQLGWRPYTGKHHESIYTRWCQTVLFPQKFGFDKRRAHLSTLVLSGQMTREAALAEMATPGAPAEQMRDDTTYVAKKLGLGDEELARLIALPPRTYHEFPNYDDAAWHRTALATFRWVRSRFRPAPSPAPTPAAPAAPGDAPSAAAGAPRPEDREPEAAASP
jgi:N-acetyl sugar amidotransferase